MTPGAEIEPGPHWWKASALTTRPTLPTQQETKRELFLFCNRKTLMIQKLLVWINQPAIRVLTMDSGHGICVFNDLNNYFRMLCRPRACVLYADIYFSSRLL